MGSTIETIVGQDTFTRADIVRMLSATSQSDIETVRRAAEKTLLRECGDSVRMRGLVEVSNVCAMNCEYCGIRRENRAVRRYTMTIEEIVDAARFCLAQGYGSMVMQAGERRDEAFVRLIEEAVSEIKRVTISDKLPDGLGITISLGEQTPETYRRWYDAGAHRYLMRIETSDPALFARIHPADQSYDSRVAALKTLRETGFQLGTGVMIGLPGQTIEHLAGDIEFFRDMDIDMIGMGPYIPHAQTPMTALGKELHSPERRFELSMLMVAVARLVLRNVNIAATTAMQALDPTGREKAFLFGANVVMPQVTPMKYREDYLLYDGKPCLGDDRSDCANCLRLRVVSTGRTVLRDAWGDSPHALQKTRR